MATITYTAKHGFYLLNTELGAWMDTTDATTDIDLDPDKNLTENGTLTKSAVADGASEFQYSGFSTGNYLERAYDADFDLIGGSPATAGHTLMAWVNIGTVTDAETIIDRQDTGGTGARYNLRIHSDGKLKATVDDGVDTDVLDSTTDLNNTGWNFIVATWDGINTQQIFINGILDISSATGGAVGSLSNGTAVFRIGLSATGTDPCAQGMSLCRVFSHDVTSANIKTIYDSEKEIFLVNSTYAVYNNSQVFTFPAMQMDRSVTGVRSVTDSIGGQRQVLFNREDVHWDIASSEIFGSDVISFQQLLSTVLRGSNFTLDPYELNEPITCNIESGKYTTERIETSNYFTFSFRVKQL